MGQSWFYARGGQKNGPVGWEMLQQMAAAGGIKPGDLVWSEGMAQWSAAASIASLFGAPPSASGAPAFAIPVSMPSEMPLDYSSEQTAYAGFWLRFAAALIDGIILLILNFGIGMGLGLLLMAAASGSRDTLGLMQMLGRVVGIVVAWLYFAVQEGSTAHATIGKRAVGIRVTDLSGQPVTFARASGRHFSKYISILTLLIGYVLAAFTPRKQALHDMIAGCLVVRNAQY